VNLAAGAAAWVAATTRATPTPTPTTAITAASTPSPAGTAPPTPTQTLETTTSGLGDFTWANAVTLGAALLAAGGVILTLFINAARSRRDDLKTLYADALGAVAEYLEGPYRILRKDGEKSTRFALTTKMSDVKTAVDHNQALLRLHARPGVADAYDKFVNAAKSEAGRQMHDAWLTPPITTDEAVNLNDPLPRETSDAARAHLVEVMQADLARRWYRPQTKRRYDDAVAATTSTTTANPAVPAPGDERPPDPS
jgi:hypothetical protein